MSAASLVVRISADMTNFSKSVREMTKDIRAAAVEVATIGAAFAPLALAGAELAKMGMEAEEVGRRFHETFGSGGAEMEEMIQQLRGSIPETTTELERMAAQVNEFARGVDIAAPQAAAMTRGLMDMAATIANAKTIPMRDVLQGLESGLMGSTKAFRQFGIDIKATAIEHEAFRLGLINSKDELDAARTSLAAYSLLLDPVSQLTSSATKANQDAAQQWRLLKSDVKELAEVIGTTLLPAVRGVIDEMRTFFDTLSHPTWQKAIDEIVVAVGTMKGDFVAAAVAQARLSANLQASKAAIPKPTTVRDIAGGMPDPSSSLGPLEALKKKSQEVLTAFSQMKDAGGDMRGVTADIVSLNKRVLSLYDEQHGKITEMGLEAQKVAHEIAKILTLRSLTTANIGALAWGSPTTEGVANVRGAAQLASTTQVSDSNLNDMAAQAQAAKVTAIRLREVMVTWIDVIDHGQLAALEFAEGLRKAKDDVAMAMASIASGFALSVIKSANDFGVAVASLKYQYSSKDNVLGGLRAGGQDVLTQFLAALGPIAIGAAAVGKILQGLQPVLDAVLEPLVSLGQILAELIVPVLHPVFEGLKAFGIVVGTIGQIIYRVAQGLANVVGGVIVGIGKLIAKIPFMGGVGRGIEDFGQSFFTLANSFGRTAQNLANEVRDLEKMKFGDTAAGILGLGNAAAFAANQLLNVPSGYRVERAIFEAMAVRSASSSPSMPFPGGGPGGGGSQSYNFAPGSIIIAGANKSGDQLLNDVIVAARKKSVVLFGTSTRAAEVFA